MDVRAIRRELGLSQENFAQALGFSQSLVRDWEPGRSRPLGVIRAYLLLIEADPKGVLKLLQAAAARKAAYPVGAGRQLPERGALFSGWRRIRRRGAGAVAASWKRR